MEVGWKFECLWDGNFSKGTPNVVCYVTHVVAVYKMPILRHVLYPMEILRDSDFE